MPWPSLIKIGILGIKSGSTMVDSRANISGAVSSESVI